MPRKPDPGLESAILKSALQIVDTAGLDLLTMRDVARGARTSTPTVYERFTNREALVWSLVRWTQNDIYRHVLHSASIEELFASIDKYLSEYPHRLDIVQRYWPVIMATGRPRPVFDLATTLLIRTSGLQPVAAQQTAMSLAALLIGTAVLRRNSGDGSMCAALVSSSQKAVRAICALPDTHEPAPV